MDEPSQLSESVERILEDASKYPLLIRYNDTRKTEIVEEFMEIDIRRSFSVVIKNFKGCKERNGK